MELTEFAVRLMLLFFPGIICFLIVDALTVHSERKPHQVFLLSFVYGILAYLTYSTALLVLNLGWLETTLGLNFPNEATIKKSLTDTKPQLNFGEIFYVTIVAILLGLAFSYAIAHKWLYDFAQWTTISQKFGDANVWARAFNSKNAKWATVRDLQQNKMYSGYVVAFSDVEEVAELLLSQVIVYNEATGAVLYRADHMYLSRPKDNLTVEIPSPPAESCSASNGKTAPNIAPLDDPKLLADEKSRASQKAKQINRRRRKR